MRILRPILSACLVALIAAPLLAADPAPAAPKLYVLHQEIVRPSGLKDYEETNHEIIAAFKQHRDMLPHFSFTTVAGEDFTYNFITPIPDFAYAGTLYDLVDKVGRTTGDAKWADLLKRNGAAIESVNDSVFIGSCGRPQAWRDASRQSL